MARGANDQVSIYTLSGPDGAVRYVGRTAALLPHRLLWHISAARQPRQPCAHWIAALLAAGQCPQIALLTTTTVLQANAVEKQSIEDLLDAGCDLLNVAHTPRFAAAVHFRRHQHRALRPRGPQANVTVRLPLDVHAAIARLAHDDERSLNSEITIGLRSYLETRGPYRYL